MGRRRTGFAVPARLREAASKFKEDAVTAVRITEANTAAPVSTGARRYRARLIAGDVQGSSGWYSASMLRESASVFRAGLPVYLDHPSASEEVDRPERSIRDLAGRLVTEAAYQRDGLYADIEVYPHWAPIIEAMRDDIGMSIRAAGTAEHGKPDGQRGPLITSITAAESVDFVTAAGAGGKIVALLESVRERGLSEATTDVIRSALSDAVQDEYGNDRTYVWVRDYDADKNLVWYDVSSGGDCDSWQQSYTITSDPAPVVTLTGNALQVVAQTVYTPVADPDAASAVTESAATTHTSGGAPPTATPLTEGTPSMSGAQNSGSAPAAQAGHTPAISAAETQPDLIVSEAKRQVAEMQLAEAKTQTDGLRTQLTEEQKATALAEARADKAEGELRQVKAQEAARSAAAKALGESDLPAVAHTKVVEAVTRNVTLTDAGVVDVAALGTAVTAAIEAERAYIASVSQANGAGTPTGLGGTATFAEAADGDIAAWEKQTNERLARIAGTNGKAA